MVTRSNEVVSAQIGVMFPIENLANGNFKRTDGQPFNIKNDGIQPVILAVRLSGMDDFIETKFEVGWNPEIVLEIRATSMSNINLKGGF